MNRALVLTLKVSVFVTLFVIIFYSIDWRDSYSILNTEGAVISRVEGTILGEWRDNDVRFRSNDTKTTEIINRESANNEKQIIISPGLLTYLKNLDLLLFSLGALCFVTSLIVLNMRWWWLLRANMFKIGVLEAQRLAWIGFFFNNVIPGSTGGDIVKAVYIAKKFSTDKVPALISVFVDRVVGLLSLILLACLASLLALDDFPQIAITVWLLSFTVVLFCTFLISSNLRKLIRFDYVINRLPERMARIVQEIDRSLLYYRQHLTGISLWILVSPITYSLFIASFWLMDKSLGIGLGFLEYCFVVPIATAIQGIPIAPAGWGVGEAVYGTLIGKVGALMQPNIDGAEQMWRTRGVTLSVLHRTHVVAWSLIGGILFLIHRSKNQNRTRR